MVGLLRGDDVAKRFGAARLKGGIGKKSYVVADRDAVIQIRPFQKWHEPVVEAHRLWKRRGCSVAELLAAGAIAGYRYYVFAHVRGEPLGWQHMTAENLTRYGRAVREMSSVSTSQFGEFGSGLSGMFGTWEEFLLTRVHRYAAALSARGLLPAGVSATDVIHCAHSTFRRSELNGGGDGRPRLLYVDVSPTNALVDPMSGQVWVIDYDYLISGDPQFVLARSSLVVENESWLRWFATGFEAADINEVTFSGYRLVHALEMLTTPAKDHGWIADRQPRLLAELESTLRVLRG